MKRSFPFLLKLYFKALRFTWTRIPQVLLSFLVYFTVLSLGIWLSTVWPQHAVLITGLTVALSVYIQKFVSGFGQKQHLAALTGMITMGLRDGRIPKKSFREGMEELVNRFESSTLLQLFSGTVKAVFQRAFRKKIRSEVIASRGRSVLADFRAVITLYGTTAIPFFGTCVMGHIFDKKNQPMLRAACDGAEIFFANRKQMFRRILLVLLVELLVFVPIAMVVMKPAIQYAHTHKEIAEAMVLDNTYTSMASETVVPTAVAFGVSIAYVAILFVRCFLLPATTIAVLTRYFDCADENPASGRLFQLLPRRVQKETEDNKDYEIERKWLVDPAKIPFDLSQYPKQELAQYYTSFSPTTRVRSVNNGEAYVLNVKSKSGADGMSREEYEFDIPQKDFEKMLKKTIGTPIIKSRYVIPSGTGFNYELDVFHGKFEGLVYLEVEFPSTEAALAFETPAFVKIEVTQDPSYRNAALAKAGRVPDAVSLEDTERTENES